jgi:two-component system sensor histidine kinase YesM
MVRMGSILLLDREIERPTLVVSFKPEIYDKAFRIDQGAKPYSFLVATPDGKYVAGNESAEGLEDAPWLADARKSKIGSGVYSVHGGDSVVCYATSLVNGWILAAFVPIRTLTAESVSYMTIVWLLIAVNALIIITVMYFASRRVTKPYYDLAFWADNVSMGNLADVGDNADNNARSRAAVRSGTVGVGDGIGTKTDDVSRTISRFNSWLDDMVQRNSEIASREQDAIISALEMQLNPHFLFNTLNIINLIAMEEGQDEISTMIVTLSGMMQHTIHLRGKFSKCAAEIEFLDKYVYLMTMRFADKFTLRYDVSPEALDAVVPKMLLQPFVENSILHGLADVESGGEIVIRAFTDEQMIVFQIEDNGAGLPPESLHTMLYGSEDHIGCSNVNQRIQLIFGKDYGISVTSMRAPTIVQLRFPYIKAN